jgi:hypothetical protein
MSGIGWDHRMLDSKLDVIDRVEVSSRLSQIESLCSPNKERYLLQSEVWSIRSNVRVGVAIQVRASERIEGVLEKPVTADRRHRFSNGK